MLVVLIYYAHHICTAELMTFCEIVYHTIVHALNSKIIVFLCVFHDVDSIHDSKIKQFLSQDSKIKMLWSLPIALKTEWSRV